MGFYEFLTTVFNNFVGIFPGPLQWVVTLLIFIGLVGALIGLVRHNWLALIIVVVLLPFLIPVFGDLLREMLAFFGFLLEKLRVTAPKS